MKRHEVWILIWLLFSPRDGWVCTSTHPCEHRKYGHRRARLDQPVLSVPTRDGRVAPHDYSDYYQGIASKAQKVREQLIEAGALESSQPNVASFGFVFFDQNGGAINNNPFYFSPEATVFQLEDPFFFFSGRRSRAYTEGDSHPWTALPESAPRSSDLKILAQLDCSRLPFGDAKKQDNKIKKALHPHLSVGSGDSLHDHWTSACMAAATYKESVGVYKKNAQKFLVHKSLAEPFFQYMHDRKKRITSQENQDVCGTLGKLLDLHGHTVNTPGVGTQPITAYYPKGRSNASSEHGDEINGEFQFTHSEQYALFKASTTFNAFAQACGQRIHTLLSQQSNDASLTDQRIVSSWACLIYSYNSMCVRCAQSVILDFNRLNCGFAHQMNTQLDQFTQPSRRLMTFMTGYTQPYDSKLHDIRLSDAFEAWMHKPQVEREDLTALNYQGYATCAPEELPQMIYHVRLCERDATGSNQPKPPEDFLKAETPRASPAGPRDNA